MHMSGSIKTDFGSEVQGSNIIIIMTVYSESDGTVFVSRQF